MTEAEWLEGVDSLAMVRFLNGKTSERKFRLFAVACCRKIDDLFHSVQCRSAVDVAERYADGEATKSELQVANEIACVGSEIDDYYVRLAADHITKPFERTAWTPCFSADALICFTNDAQSSVIESEFGIEAAKAASIALIPTEVALIREHFGNPFRPVAFHPAWLTPTAVALANGIYADRAFDRMPILADALEEAGCDNADVLLHCRGEGPHVKGCWVINAVLGKE